MDTKHSNQAGQAPFQNEAKQSVPFMFHFGRRNDSASVRQPGMESEFWSEAYKTTDTD
jgi:hypothetical protein